MQCLHPLRIKNPNLFVNGDMRHTIEVPCGHCVACRIARSREWAVRLLHESEFWDDFCFVTLTYDDEHLFSPSLVPRDLTLFFKKLRRDLGEKKIKYFACGEYGDRFGRPHYHAIIFGLGTFDKKLIQENWNKGYVKVGTLTYQSCRYVAGYVQKKLYGKDSKYYEDNGLVPPFSRCSKGLGLEYVDKYWNKLYSMGRVTVNGVPMALPRYYTKKLDFDKYLIYDSSIEQKEYDDFLDRNKNIVSELNSYVVDGSLSVSMARCVLDGYYMMFKKDKNVSRETYLEAKSNLKGGRQ